VKLRLHGTCAEATQATRRLVQFLEVVAVSPPYLDRGASVLIRVYLEVPLPEATGRPRYPLGVPPGPLPGRRAIRAGGPAGRWVR
jgi:hypothetical protein